MADGKVRVVKCASRGCGFFKRTRSIASVASVGLESEGWRAVAGCAARSWPMLRHSLTRSVRRAHGRHRWLAGLLYAYRCWWCGRRGNDEGGDDTTGWNGHVDGDSAGGSLVSLFRADGVRSRSRAEAGRLVSARRLHLSKNPDDSSRAEAGVSNSVPSLSRLLCSTSIIYLQSSL